MTEGLQVRGVFLTVQGCNPPTAVVCSILYGVIHTRGQSTVIRSLITSDCHGGNEEAG
jgi:hypothetical protein